MPFHDPKDDYYGSKYKEAPLSLWIHKVDAKVIVNSVGLIIGFLEYLNKIERLLPKNYKWWRVINKKFV